MGIEFPMFVLTNLVDGQTPLVLDWPTNWYTLLVHWIVTTTNWTAGVLVAYWWARRVRVLGELVRFRMRARDAYVIAAGAVLAIAFSLVHAWLTGLAVPQILREHRGFRATYCAHAWILSVFQKVYYLVEFVLVGALVAALWDWQGGLLAGRARFGAWFHHLMPTGRTPPGCLPGLVPPRLLPGNRRTVLFCRSTGGAIAESTPAAIGADTGPAGR